MELEPLVAGGGGSSGTSSPSSYQKNEAQERRQRPRQERRLQSHAWVWVALAVVGCAGFWMGRIWPFSTAHPEQSVMNADATASSNNAEDLQALKSTSVLSGLHNGAVAADHKVCSDLGLQILKDQGGNAVDAAVTVALCLGVANPASSGLGGGAFLLVHVDDLEKENTAKVDFVDARVDQNATTQSIHGKVTEVVDCREIAPAAASKLMYHDLPKHASERGGLAVGVPGELKCLELAHARHGKLSWYAVVHPVYQLARHGVPINANLAHEIGILKHRYSLKMNQELDWGLRALLTHGDTWRKPKVEGDVLRNLALARTLRSIRDGGADALYKGPRAAQLAQDIQDNGGIVTQQDLEGYQATLRTPIVAHDVHGFSLVGVPPPSSGGAVIVGASRFLASYKTPFATFSETLSMHRFVEACKHAFAIRMSLSDPNYGQERNLEAVRDLTQGKYMEELKRNTSDENVLPLSMYGGVKWAQIHDRDGDGEAVDANEGDRRKLRQSKRKLARRFGYLEDNGTSHFSIVDKDGNSVSMTTSVNTYFGSNVLSKSQGIVLSNTMDDFATPGRPNYFGLQPSEENFIEPGKKPLSSMSPTMVFRRPRKGDTHRLGDLVLVLGASGGPKIISAVLQVLTRVILQGMPLFDALVHPRVHDQLIYHGAAVTTTENTVLEQGPGISVSQETRDALEKRGHDLLDVTYEGTVQAITIDLETTEITAACDVRKGGSPAGY